MIKNFVFDIGGVVLDNSKETLQNYLNKTENETKELTKIVYGSSLFKKVLLGDMSQTECMEQLIIQYPEHIEDIEKILSVNYQKEILPLKRETLDIIYKLKEKNYKIYLLSNLTAETYNYIKNELNILDIFDGGIFSFKDKLLKPHKEIYELLLNRYNLNKEETIFFDDILKNVEAGNELGIKSIQFKTVEDIINIIEEPPYGELLQLIDITKNDTQ